MSLKAMQVGVGLIEVLIAVLVLSIGLLGLAALQTRALSSTGGSSVQTMAAIASYSILDAMRLDKANALTGQYNNGGADLVANACPAAGSTLASLQLHDWCTQLGAALGLTASTKGNINCDSTGACTIKVYYDNSKTTGGSNSQTIVTQAGL